MHPADRVLMRRQLAWLASLRAELVDHLGDASASDYADYRDRCGYLRALRDVAAWCEDVKAQDDERPDETRRP